MIVAKIADQLGNQMFTYASLKTLAQKRDEEFCFVREDNARINDSDQKYGCEIHTIFPGLEREFLEQVPERIHNVYQEPPLKERKTNFQKSALQVPPDTLMLGHYISCRYFMDNLEDVRAWFTFPHDVAAQVEEELASLRRKYPGRPLASVHFRIGEDYLRQGFLLESSYWLLAAERLAETSAAKPVFLLFYDKKEGGSGIVDAFLQKYECEVCRGSLVHDLCMMSRCRQQIICNSSFSIMSALLNPDPDKQIFRPSVYPVGKCFYPTDCFADDWIVVPARQSRRSRLCFFWMSFKGGLLRLLRPAKRPR